VTEGRIYQIFNALGYPSLLSFEMARITTIADPRWGQKNKSTGRWTAISDYANALEGVLPQGSPTSPMLSNLAMFDLDHRLAEIANEEQFTYTRYSDDLIFSTMNNKTYDQVKNFRHAVTKELLAAGFKYNRQKSVIRGPGARRIVLGAIVNGSEPRLPKEDKDLLRQHLYYLTNPIYGPSKHTLRRKMSISTLYHHVRGKIAWAEQIEPLFGKDCLDKFNSVRWPPIRPSAYHRRQIQQARQS
jgi:RNA-directed DNA polymerase